MTAVEDLRLLLGEPIPDGGTEDDTMFTDLQIQSFLDDANGDEERAAYLGWRAKAAQAANWVDVTEGNASRKMSQIRQAALDMVALYSRSRAGPTEGRTRIGKIRRPTSPR